MKHLDGPSQESVSQLRGQIRRHDPAGCPQIRVALLSPGLSMGGAERWLVSLPRYSDSSRVQWTGVAISSAGGTDGSLCREIARYMPLHTQQDSGESRPSGRPFHRQYFNSHKTWPLAVSAACDGADIVLAWGGVYHVGCWVADLQIPRVIVSHTTQREPECLPIHGLTHLAAVSEAAAAYFDGRPGRDQFDGVAVIYNGADRRRCRAVRGRAAQRARWQMQPGQYAIGYLGREAPEKNFLAAARGVSRLGGSFRAVYHSSLVSPPGEHAAELTELQQKHPDRILLCQPKPHVGDILAGLDALVLASHREAFSLSLIEAWLSGVPVVATPVGSLPELQSRFGRKLAIEVPVDPSDRQLAAALRRAVGAEGREIARYARQVARSNFTCEKMVGRWTEYLTGIVSPDSVGACHDPLQLHLTAASRG